MTSSNIDTTSRARTRSRKSSRETTTSPNNNQESLPTQASHIHNMSPDTIGTAKVSSISDKPVKTLILNVDDTVSNSSTRPLDQQHPSEHVDLQSSSRASIVQFFPSSSILASPAVAPAAERDTVLSTDTLDVDSTPGPSLSVQIPLTRSTSSQSKRSTPTTPSSPHESISKDNTEDLLREQEALISRQIIKCSDNQATFEAFSLFAKQAHFRNTVFAIKHIIEKKLYFFQHKSVEDYFRDVWSVSRAQVYRLMDCCAVLEHLLPRNGQPLQGPISIKSPYEPLDSLRIPFKERICRAIKNIAGGNGHVARYIWEKTLEMFPDEESLSSSSLQQVWKDTPISDKKSLGVLANQYGETKGSGSSSKKRSSSFSHSQATSASSKRTRSEHQVQQPVLRSSTRRTSGRTTRANSPPMPASSSSTSAAPTESTKRNSAFSRYRDRSSQGSYSREEDMEPLALEDIDFTQLGPEKMELYAPDSHGFQPIAQRIQTLLQSAQSLSEMDGVSPLHPGTPSTLVDVDVPFERSSSLEFLAASCSDVDTVDALPPAPSSSQAKMKDDTSSPQYHAELALLGNAAIQAANETDSQEQHVQTAVSQEEVTPTDTNYSMDSAPSVVKPQDDTNLFLGFVMAVRAGRTMAF